MSTELFVLVARAFLCTTLGMNDNLGLASLEESTKIVSNKIFKTIDKKGAYPRGKTFRLPCPNPTGSLFAALFALGGGFDMATDIL